MMDEPVTVRTGHMRGCFGGQSARPLTVADRLPLRGDKFRNRDGSEIFFIGSGFSGGSRISDVTRGEDGEILSVRIQTGDIILPDGGDEYPAYDLIYTARADGGEVTVRE